MKTAFISMPNVCPRNLLTGAKFIDYFKSNGWKITTLPQEADLLLFGVCGVTIEAENASLKYLAIAARKLKAGARLVVAGCLAGINEPLILKIFNAIVINRHNINQLDSITNAKYKINDFKDPNELDNYAKYFGHNYHTLDRQRAEFRPKLMVSKLLSRLQLLRFGKISLSQTKEPEAFYIRIARGCSGICSYCAIKNSVGPLNSRPLNEILTEFATGLSKGYKAIRLIAEDVGSYGQDNGTNIVELLQGLFGNEEHFQLLIDDFSPKWLIKYFPELIAVLSKNKPKIGYLGLELQSGNERILKMMQREYTAEDAKNCILNLQKSCPGLDVRTHVLIGFPGETDTEFMDTLNFVKTVSFSQVGIYKYSDRPHTGASLLPGKIAERTIMKRIRRLIGALEGRAFIYN